MKAFGLVAVTVLVTAASACSGTRRPDIETHATPGEDVLASPPDSIERALDAFGVGVQPSGGSASATPEHSCSAPPPIS
jgi:hypothetical protein